MILSIHGGHNASIAIVFKREKNVACYSIEAERFDRIKMSCCCERYIGNDFSPKTKSKWVELYKTDFNDLINALLLEAGVRPEEISEVILSQNTALDRLPKWVLEKKISTVTHHLAHAALSYYTSPFDEAVAIVCDGGGEIYEDGIEITTSWVCKENRIVPLLQTRKKDMYSMGIGNAYELYTYWLGYGYNGCGTTMALASFATEEPLDVREIFHFSQKGDIYLKKEFIDVRKHIEAMGYKKQGTAAYNQEHEQVMRSLPLPKNYKLREYKEASVKPEFIRMANDIQNATEKAVCWYIHHVLKRHSSKYLCLSGGTFLNCNLNTLIREMEEVRDIHVPCAPGDGGLALGGALYKYFESNPKCPVEYSPYIGAKIQTVKHVNGNFHMEKQENIYQYTAQKLTEGNLIGWCQGRAEFGPRALGHRSLVADPRNIDTPNKINKMLKHREPFRPFAPSVLEEHFHECFEGSMPLPYMLETRKVRSTWLGKIPAVCHVDYSARVQIVREQDSPEYAKLLRAFFRLTGVPILVNTSLNRNGEPIVDRADDALAILEKKMIDKLVIGNVVYTIVNENNGGDE